MCIVPQLALSLSNSKLAFEMSGLVAARIKKEEFVSEAFKLLLGRTPDSVERNECLKTIEEFKALAFKSKKGNPDLRARRGLVHALLNHNDFVSIR